MNEENIYLNFFMLGIVAFLVFIMCASEAQFYPKSEQLYPTSSAGRTILCNKIFSENPLLVWEWKKNMTQRKEFEKHVRKWHLPDARLNKGETFREVFERRR